MWNIRKRSSLKTHTFSWHLSSQKLSGNIDAEAAFAAEWDRDCVDGITTMVRANR
jgi:hypothetical protein